MVRFALEFRNSIKIVFQCRQITTKMDVGYTRMIEEQEFVVNRRNYTINVGCACMPQKVRRYQQIGAFGIP